MQIQFVEWGSFTKKLARIATDAELLKLQDELLANPEKGDVIPGAGGARKVRMATGHSGKSGGARVIYYVRVSRDRIFFLDVFGKGEKADLTPQERKAIAMAIMVLKEDKNGKSTRKT
jgi:hypothetical protein